MGTAVLASNVLANGLRTEFVDTYTAIRNRQMDGRLGLVMDLNVSATNRQHEFAYFNAAPHMEYWRRGDSIPTDAFDSVTFTVPIYEWAKRIPWLKWDRKDDQTQSLMESARMAGESAALLPERFFFDIIVGSTNTLPAVPNAPDGVDMFNATDGGGGARFDFTGGNILTGGNITTLSGVKSSYYAAIEQFLQFQDGQGQPMFPKDIVDQGTIIIHPASATEVFEEAFLQRRVGINTTTDASGAAAQSSGVVGIAGTTPTNVVHDASRNVELWGSSRLTDANDWFIFLRNPPKQATFFLEREGLQEFEALEGGNNSDHVRDTGEEYVQWESRSGAGVALPYAAIQISNT